MPIFLEHHPHPTYRLLDWVVPRIVNLTRLLHRSLLIVVRVLGKSISLHSSLRVTDLSLFPTFKANPYPGAEMDQTTLITQTNLSGLYKINIILRHTDQANRTISALEALNLPRICPSPRATSFPGAATRQFLQGQRQSATRQPRALVYSPPL